MHVAAWCCCCVCTAHNGAIGLMLCTSYDIQTAYDGTISLRFNEPLVPAPSAKIRDGMQTGESDSVSKYTPRPKSEPGAPAPVAQGLDSQTEHTPKIVMQSNIRMGARKNLFSILAQRDALLILHDADGANATPSKRSST